MEIIIVDEHDHEIETKNIGDVNWNDNIYRASIIMLYNKSGEILLAQRSFTKTQSPGIWGSSAAGIHEAGETYLSNILKETEEELGIALDKNEIVVGPKIRTHHTDPVRHHFSQWFFARCDYKVEDFVIQEDEVAGVRWMSIADFGQEFETHPEQFVDVTPEIIAQIPWV